LQLAVGGWPSVVQYFRGGATDFYLATGLTSKAAPGERETVNGLPQTVNPHGQLQTANCQRLTPNSGRKHSLKIRALCLAGHDAHIGLNETCFL
jgi:hypothetical protein